MAKKYKYLDTTTGREGADDGPVSAGGSYAVKASNQSSSSTTLADITDLSVTLAANTAYHVESLLLYTGNTLGQGHTIAVVTPTTPDVIALVALSYSAATGANVVSYPITTNGGTMTTLNSGGTTTKHDMIQGMIITGASGGTLKLQFSTETAGTGTTTIEAGSYLIVTPVTPA